MSIFRSRAHDGTRRRLSAGQRRAAPAHPQHHGRVHVQMSPYARDAHVQLKSCHERIRWARDRASAASPPCMLRQFLVPCRRSPAESTRLRRVSIPSPPVAASSGTKTWFESARCTALPIPSPSSSACTAPHSCNEGESIDRKSNDTLAPAREKFPTAPWSSPSESRTASQQSWTLPRACGALHPRARGQTDQRGEPRLPGWRGWRSEWWSRRLLFREEHHHHGLA